MIWGPLGLQLYDLLLQPDNLLLHLLKTAFNLGCGHRDPAVNLSK